MKRELSYREEMVQQLHIVRGEKNKAKAADTTAFQDVSNCRIYRYFIAYFSCKITDDSLYAQLGLFYCFHI